MIIGDTSVFSGVPPERCSLVVVISAAALAVVFAAVGAVFGAVS